MRAYRVLGVKAQPGRLRGIGGVSAPLIGRDRELGLIREALRQLREGRGQIMCLIGEAGLGKSRLLEEAAAALSARAEAAAHYAHALESADRFQVPPTDLARVRQRQAELAAASGAQGGASASA